MKDKTGTGELGDATLSANAEQLRRESSDFLSKSQQFLDDFERKFSIFH